MTTRTVDVFLTNQDDVQTSWLADARQVAKRHDIALTEHWADDAVTQTREIVQAAWSTTNDALVILAKTPNGPSKLIREAVSRGKSVVLLNRALADMDESAPWSWPNLRKEFPTVLTATVVADALHTGRVQAQQFKTLLPKGGNILYVLGDPASSDGVERYHGIEELLANDRSFTISIAVGGFREDTAETACRRWLRTALGNPGFKLDLVGSQSEVMVPGIRRALQFWAESASRPDFLQVPMTAVDGTPQYKQEVDRGLLAATVETQSRAAAAIELLAKYWYAKAIPPQPIVELPVSSYPSLERLSGHAVRQPRRATAAAPAREPAPSAIAAAK